MVDQQQYLQAMGIQYWQLVHPQRLAGYQPQLMPLDPDCRLLLISPSFPSESEILWLEKVLKSFHVTLVEARQVFPEHIAQLDLTHLAWIWYAGCEVSVTAQANLLHTPPLSVIKNDTRYRRDLWQQICSYSEQ
ncbi:DNA polymerase III subunit psi [Vibrio sp. V27_P1S3P104]|uniref:DNA polymerase III subunit psi n=1 Tax=unclassified Vibrio TaxID=2614977 RepID=UPI0013735B41|nr:MULTISPECIES: DNA polymerase III subunit psi [unclassified Vibrio]NAW70113.1 DNA polymerase III subunit psi [Vibrio sp. V28_P6S34P95]NAX04198.1 DNA polymerase III subunit psi [Vibrio sp. V30_P3S12P165]NAX34928.1 DNA polymerase III subunit psi [Vibrio sp. V29_P1S30P107]NAX37667.1 DNA polymerase III subunit psi [Vibrio sp. V27_P1S3P104]NAX40582.1 DNA polymerase III subunit psi [Vibrio sp. V26_P1S5P106]